MSKIFRILLFAFIICFNGFAQTLKTLSLEYRIKKLPFNLEEKTPLQKPIVAIALSGGGSRGLSQIGVIKALSENNIPMDVIVGTSMGSIVGGLFSAGYSPDELDSIACNTDWGFLLALDRETNRRDLFVDQKISEDRAVFALRLKGLKPVFPTAINNGMKLSHFLNLLALEAPIHVKNNFDELLTKYRAVSSNLVTGNAEVLYKGSLSRALRASSSVSFLLSPVHIDSLTLVDGGLVANIPVQIAKSIGKDYVIAVDATSPLLDENSLELPWVVADQLVSIPMKHLNETQLSSANHIITPPLKNRTSSDFSNLHKSIVASYESTLPHIKEIKKDLDSLYHSRLVANEFYIKNVSFRGDAKDFEVPYQIKYSKKDSVSSSEILRDMSDLFESGVYSSVSAEITSTDKFSQIKFVVGYNPVIKRVNISGVTITDKKEMQNLFSNLENKPYNASMILKNAIAGLKLYRINHYPLAEIDTIYFNERTKTLYVQFNEGQISKIVVEGNSSTNPIIIIREIANAENGYFTWDDIQRSLKNISSTNLFEDINISPRKASDENYLIVKVIEKTSSLLRFGFKLDDSNGAQVSIDTRDENFSGSGSELGLITLLGSRNQSFILEQKANRIFNTYLTYKINAFYTLNDIYTFKNDNYSRSQDGEYSQTYYGLALSVGAQVGRFGNFMIKGSYQKDEIKNLQLATVDPYKITLASLKGILTIDTQDKYPYPTKGIYFAGEYETSQKLLGGDLGYTNFGFNYKSYFTFFQDYTLSPKLVMGFADKTLPLSQQYSLGGLNSFFGMRDNEYRGRQIFLTSLEYRYKLSFLKLVDTYFLARYDLGSTWEVQDQLRFKDLKHGVGATLSFNTPIGPADFSVGRSFEFRKTSDANKIVYGPVRFYFSIGFYY
jgi:NTE family protein